MIHVCRLDVGSRHVFDSADGIDDVGLLANAIEHHFSIEKQKQILLISGGEILSDNTQKLYRLSAGREESPIYLIDQSNVEKDSPPKIENPLDSLTQDMLKELEAAILLKPSYQTVLHRSQLATRVYDLGRNLYKLCQSFYDDQYWQYQGFLALIANLDEFFSSFRKRKEVINEQFEKYLCNRDYNKDLLKDIDKYIEILSNIRILPQIIPNISTENPDTPDKTCINTPPNPSETLFSGFSSQSIADLQALQINENKLKQNSSSCLTLLEWIKSTDPQNRLNNVIDETREMLTHFDTNFRWGVLQEKINKLVDQIENPQMREIEGLTKRLQDLNNFLEDSKKFLAGQNDIVESLNANKDRATNLKDESILKDLCLGHVRQLELFKSNHMKMIEITRTISKAKLELIRVIHSRLNWVMQVQKQLADNDFQLQIYFKQLKRMNTRIKLIDHIKKAPAIYLCSMRETIRRQHFSKIYKTFAELINILISKIYNDELNKRQAFDTKIGAPSQHFILNILFRSLADKVEPFLNDSALKFDTELPVFDENEVTKIENDLLTQLTNLRMSSFDSSTSSSSTSGTSSSSSAQQLENSSPMFESPQSSATKSSESGQSLSKNSKLAKFNENFLADLNLDEYKVNPRDDSNLRVLNDLNEILSNNKILEEDVINKGVCDPVLIKARQDTAEIKTQLNSAKNIIKDCFSEFKADIETLVNKQDELQKAYSAIGEQAEHKQIDLKTKFYKDFQDFLESDKTFLQEPNNVDEFLSSQTDKTNIEFSQNTFKYIQTCHSHYYKKNEQQQLGNKQKTFNEAIKKVTQEKDKIIQELRQKETAHLEEIAQLKANLEEATKASKALDEKSEPIINEIQNNSIQIVNTKITLKKEDSLPTIPEADKSAQTPEHTDETEDINQTKMKLRELMLMEKITQLEKQLALFTTLPVTNDYETIQLNSCNIDDLVIAVYSEEYGSYKIIHKSSSYLHFVHSAIFKSHEQRLSFKSNSMKSSQIATSPTSESHLSAVTENSNMEIQFPNPNDISIQSSSFGHAPSVTKNNPININNTSFETSSEMGSSSTILVKNSPSDNIQNIFLAEKQPQWFVGRVLVKEFCIARKENNRFKVPSGTRFYRVKLKPYNL